VFLSWRCFVSIPIDADRDERIYVFQIEIQSKLKIISMHQTMVPNSRKLTYHLKN